MEFLLSFAGRLAVGLFLGSVGAVVLYVLTVFVVFSFLMPTPALVEAIAVVCSGAGAGVGGGVAWLRGDSDRGANILRVALSAGGAVAGALVGLSLGTGVIEYRIGIPELRGIWTGAVLGSNLVAVVIFLGQEVLATMRRPPPTL